MLPPNQPPINLPPLILHQQPPSTIIFLHGLGDDGHGTGYGLAQQFQHYQKLPHTKWVLPTAPLDPAVGQRCWYKPSSSLHDLHEEKHKDADADADEEEEEDGEGILKAVEYIDSLVAAEVDENGLDPSRIVIGGFSQGCAVSMVWGLTSAWRDKVGGVFGLSGYFPRLQAVRPGTVDALTTGGRGRHAPRWFFGHGMADQLISTKLFADGQRRLQEHVAREHIEGHVYEQLGHDIGAGELRDFWLWLKMVFQE